MGNYDVENLLRVWPRVTGEEPGDMKTLPGPPEDLAARIGELIDDEEADAAMYTLLAMKTRGSRAEGRLRRLASEERAHGRRLQSEYFMLTGDTWTPKKRHPSAPYLLRALRERYIGEMQGAANYETLAQQMQDPRLRTMFFELGRDERRHAGVVREIIESLMR